MPPLPSVEIPVIVRSDFKGKTPVRAPKPRMYNDEPLPVVPSNYAPKNAKIVGREIKISGVSYHLKIGEVEINDVSVQEILEYVSALDLEQYEHEQFEEERVALKVAEAAEEERKREKLERMKHRAKTKGVVFYASDTGSNDETEGGEEVVGRHGRARPTYTHLFMKINPRKGKAIEPSSDMMLTATDEDEDEEESEDEPVVRVPIVRGPISFTELPKRRRRKRDKVTGELLPLSPKVQKAQSALSEKKRQRRRRHPLTGELMPVGWRYDPNDQSDTYENRRTGPSMSARKLSSSQEHAAKRPKLDTASEMSRSSSPLPAKGSPARKASLTTPRGTIGQHGPQSKLAAVVNLVSSEDERGVRSPTKAAMPLKSPPKPMQSRPTISAMMRSAALSSAAETSPEPVLRPFLPPPGKTKITSPKAAKRTASPKRSKTPKTSILNPSAGRASSTEPPVQLSNEDEDEDEESDDEYFIENVLAHSWSDPRTHPSSLGDKPVMLYQVKWEGYTEPSWCVYLHATKSVEFQLIYLKGASREFH